MPSRSDLVTDDVEEAAEVLARGGLVAIPTETVYGLAAVADRPESVARIFEIKGRPADHPLIVHVADADRLAGWVDAIPIEASTLATACWPGPLTMLLRRGARTPDVVTGGRPTVGVRVPAHPLTGQLLDLLDTGLAAPSANRFGRVSPTTVDHVLDDIGDLLDPARDRILDGGACDVGVESTIVDLTVRPPQVLRAGAIDADTIGRLLHGPVDDAAGPSRASGMLASHYAPACTLVLVETAEEARSALGRATAAGERVDLLDRTDDLVEAARHLYDDLRSADRAELAVLVVRMPPPRGLGLALRDRLGKAAVRRPDPPGPLTPGAPTSPAD
ncbi:MAG: L-threonylcarbamoyladenylate synthase [Ilumatobacteraceae bacterium]